MRLSTHSFKNIIKRFNIVQERMLLPTPFDNHPEPMTLVNEFIERILYKHMYYAINHIDLDSKYLQDDVLFYKPNYISFLLYLSTSTVNYQNDKSVAIVREFKEEFYKKVVADVLMNISLPLKIIFYRYYEYNGIPKLEINESVEHKNFIIVLKDMIKQKILGKKEIENVFDKYIENLYVVSDKALNDYILDWIKFKFDFLASDLTIWRAIQVSTSEFINLKDENLEYWADHDVFTQNTANRDINRLVSLAEFELFINKMKYIFDRSSYINFTNLTKNIVGENENQRVKL